MEEKILTVRQGRIPGIYESWDECKAQVDGYKNAEHKSFKAIEEAEQFMNRGYQVNLAPKTIESSVVPLLPKESPEFVAYVDGSYLNGAFSYGCVLFDGENVKEFKRAFYHHKDADMRNVAGELEGAKKAIDYALKHKAASLDIYYDYKGIECWANGEWKTNKTATATYKKYGAQARNLLEIRFYKVKGHSGDTWNERADRLAKQALEL